MNRDIYGFRIKDIPIFLLFCIALIINHRSGYITLVGLFSIYIFLAHTVKNKIDNISGIIFLYVIFYIVFSFFNGFSYSMSTLILYAISPFIFYQYGHYLIKKCNSENICIFIWFLIILCYCIDVFNLTIFNIIKLGQIVNPTRSFSFDEENMTEIAATLVGLPMDIGMIGLPMLFIVKNKYLRICFFLLFFFSLITTFHLLNRTGLIIAGFCTFILVFLRYRKNIKMIMLFIFVLILFGYILYSSGIITNEILEFYDNRNDDLTTMGSRSYRWSNALSHLFIDIFGWYDGKEDYFIHNMWLDVARISGIIPFSLLFYLTYNSFKKVLYLVKCMNNSLSYMFLGLNICFFLSCFVEPIYGGTHMILYCMLWGSQNALVIKCKKKLNENTICNRIISH